MAFFRLVDVEGGLSNALENDPHANCPISSPMADIGYHFLSHMGLGFVK